LSDLSASETFTVEYHKSTPADNTTYSEPLTKVSDNEWWQIDRAGTATADVTYYWEDSKWSGIGNFDDLRLAHWNSTSSKWEVETGTYTNTGNASLSSVESGTLKVTDVSSFSPFAPGTIDNQSNTLPIELVSFYLLKQSEVVQLNWVTASELNNSGFEIQRSSDAKEWQRITFVEGAGNSNEILKYTFVDNKPNMVNYYRLKQIDFDGAFEYSQMLYAELASNNNISIYPNPTNNTLNISGFDRSEIKTIALYNNMGKLIRKISVNTTKIDVSGLSSGYYFIQLKNINGSCVNQEFIKK